MKTGPPARVLPVPQPGDVPGPPRARGEVRAAAGAGRVRVAPGLEELQVERGRAPAAEHVAPLVGSPLRELRVLRPRRPHLLDQRQVRHGSAVRSPGKPVALGGRLSAGGGGVGVRTAPGLAGVASDLDSQPVLQLVMNPNNGVTVCTRSSAAHTKNECALGSCAVLFFSSSQHAKAHMKNQILGSIAHSNSQT